MYFLWAVLILHESISGFLQVMPCLFTQYVHFHSMCVCTLCMYACVLMCGACSVWYVVVWIILYLFLYMYMYHHYNNYVYKCKTEKFFCIHDWLFTLGKCQQCTYLTPISMYVTWEGYSPKRGVWLSLNTIWYFCYVYMLTMVLVV